MYGLITLIDKIDEKEIYRKVNEYGNVHYFYIDLSEDISEDEFVISGYNDNGSYMQTKQTYYLKRLLADKKNEEVKQYYQKYYNIFTYEEAMSVFQDYYLQVTRKEDRIECMKLLGLCGVHYALAYICTLFKCKDKIIQFYARTKIYTSNVIFFIITDDKKEYIEKEFDKLIEKGYLYSITPKELSDIFTDEELHQIYLDIQDGEYYTDILTRKLFQDMLMCNKYIEKYTLLQAEKKLGQDLFRKRIKCKQIKRKIK